MSGANALLLVGFLKGEFLWKKTGVAVVVELKRFLESYHGLLMKMKACRCSCFLGSTMKKEAIEKTQFGGPGHFAHLFGGHFAKLFDGHFVKISQP